MDSQRTDLSDLKGWLYQHLRMESDSVSDINFRRDEAPFEKPISLWKTGSAKLKKEFERAINELLEDSATTSWDPRDFNELVRVVETIKSIEAKDTIEKLVRSKTFLTHNNGEHLHMQALRTLLALNWNGTLGFWFSQEKIIAAKWPALIFKGLARHGMDAAFARLPDLLSKKASAQEFLTLFPRLVENVPGGISALGNKAFSMLHLLPHRAAEDFREWFRLQGYSPNVFVDEEDDSLEEGIRGVIGEFEALPSSAALAGKRKNACALR